MNEQEKIKYIKLNNKLNNIKNKVDILSNKHKELIILLNNSLTITKEIIEKENNDYISDEIKKAKESINYSISIINKKI